MSPAGKLFARDSLLIQALSQAKDSIELLDTELRLVWVNAAFERLHGRTRDEVVGRTPAELGLGAQRYGAEHRKAAEAVRAGRSYTGEVVASRPDGTEVPIELTVSSLRDDDGTLRGYFAIKRDRSEAIHAQAQRQRRESELESLLDRIPVGIVIQGGGVIRYVNATFIDLMGGNGSFVGHDVFDWVHPEDRALIAERVAVRGQTGEPLSPVELRGLNRRGEVIHVRSHPIGFLDYRGERCFCGVLQDLTSERETREATVTADRLQTIGQVAAGVAHEVNNPLTWMITGLEEIQGELEETASPAVRRRLAEAIEGAHRIRHVVRELALFTRDDREEIGACELGEIAIAATDLARRAIEARGTLVLEPAPGPVWVAGNAPKLGQVMLNLVLNAAAAIPDDRSGRVEVRWGATGGEAILDVCDDGIGMPAEVRARAFEPFFTTRAGRGGTGLGLAISRNIVGALGGTIELESAPGAGTRVRLCLRTVAPPALRAKKSVPSLESMRVLVVDDERLVARSLCRRIRQMGHECEAVNDACQALHRMREEEFDVVLCDLMMPDLDGQALYAAVLAEAPELAERMIFMTGGAFTHDAQAFLAALDRPWLAKPFDDDDITRALSHHLAR